MTPGNVYVTQLVQAAEARGWTVLELLLPRSEFKGWSVKLSVGGGHMVIVESFDPVKAIEMISPPRRALEKVPA